MLRRLLIVALPSTFALSAATAQTPQLGPMGRNAFSIALIQSRPQGALRENIGLGYGGDFAYLLRLDHSGTLSLRADLGFIDYGNESFDTPLSTTIGGRITVRVRTTNNFVPMSIGPQLGWPAGPVRPYINGGIGGQYFFTQSSVRGLDSEEDIASTTNQSDWTRAWTAGGGVYIPLSQKKVNVLLDIGAQYYGGGRAEYLRPGSIEDIGNGNILIHAFESETHLVLVRLGVKVGF
jgi:opacity protein-like surface antigen